MAPFQRDEFQSVSSSSSTTSLNGVNAWFTWKSAISSRGIKGRRRRCAYLFDPRNTDFFSCEKHQRTLNEIAHSMYSTFRVDADIAAKFLVPRSWKLLQGTIYQDHRKIKEKIFKCFI